VKVRRSIIPPYGTNYSGNRAKTISLNDSKNRFLEDYNEQIIRFSKGTDEGWQASFKQFGEDLIRQGEEGINFWRNEIQKIRNLSRAEAIERLIDAMHYKTSINSIQGMLKKIEQHIRSDKK